MQARQAAALGHVKLSIGIRWPDVKPRTTDQVFYLFFTLFPTLFTFLPYTLVAARLRCVLFPWPVGWACTTLSKTGDAQEE